MGGKQDQQQQQQAATSSLYSTITPHFTQDLLTPGLKIGYQDDSGVWEFIERSLVQRLPLRSIEWKNRVGVLKCIDKLQLNFVDAAITRSNSNALKVAQNMPIVCLYVVKCEEMETYKSQVRSQLMAWVDQMNLLRVEWMILYVPLGTRAKATPSSAAKAMSSMSSGVASAMAMATHRNSSSHSIYKKIYEKIKSDFSSKKTSERTCKIEILDNSTTTTAAHIAAPGQQQQHDAQWSELLLKLRNCIMAAFETKCFQYEEELRVLDAKRATNGWGFGAFFLAKDRLALMYQQAYLLDDAIRHMDELEAIFSSMTPNEATLTLDKSAKRLPSSLFRLSPLALDLDSLPAQIASSQASTLSIRLYLFCRQIQILYLAGDFFQLIQRALSFCSAFVESLTTLNELHWIEPFQWVVGACLEIAYACELSWGGHDYQVSSASVSEMATKALTPEQMSRQLAHLLYLARRFLKSAQLQKQHQDQMQDPPQTASSSSSSSLSFDPATADLEELNPVATTTRQVGWYGWLRRALMDSSADSYERILYEVSHLASLHFSRAGSHRLAVFLGTQCARFHLARGEYESASRLLRSYVRQCKEDKWWQLMRVNVRLVCQCELELGRAAQAVAACFNLLEIAQKEHHEEAIGREDWSQVMQALVQRLELHQDKAQDDDDGSDGSMRLKMGELIHPQVDVETMQTDPQSTLSYGQIRVNLKLTNRFPTGIQIGKVRVKFAWQKSAERHSLDTQDSRSSIESRALSMPAATSEHPQVDMVVCEEENVYLYENTSVHLSFLKENLEVGVYTCEEVECVLAGFSFALVNEDIQTISFEIPQRESKLQLQLLAPPLLCRGTREQVQVQIDSVDDFVMGGSLEVTVANETESDQVQDQDDKQVISSIVGVSFLDQGHQVRENIADTCDPAVILEAQETRIRLELPPCIAGCGILYTIALAVGKDADTCSPVKFVASLRYQRASSRDVVQEFRQSQTYVRIDRPLSATTWMKVLHDRVFVSMALQCNSHVGIVLDRYELSDLLAKGFEIVQDPNGQFANCQVDPSKNFHMALVLKAPSTLSLDDTRCAIEFGFHLVGSGANHTQWAKTHAISLDFGGLLKPHFMLDATIKTVGSIDTKSTRFAIGDDVVFEISVRRFQSPLTSIGANEPEQQQQQEQQQQDALYLELDPQSDGDWVVIDKQMERLILVTTTTGDKTQDPTASTNPFDVAATGSKAQATSQSVFCKRLMPCRVGRVAFPRFRLWLDTQVSGNLVQLQVGQSVLITAL